MLRAPKYLSPALVISSALPTHMADDLIRRVSRIPINNSGLQRKRVRSHEIYLSTKKMLELASNYTTFI